MRFLLLTSALFLAACGAQNEWRGSESDLSALDHYPKTPLQSLTPGALCSDPESYRYPEQIAYCGRHVAFALKAEVFHIYEQEYGSFVSSVGRSRFKIDHLIPLCMGGGNVRENLWPQFEDIYGQTDPIESGLCDLMASGRLKQSEAIELIRKAKADPERAHETLDKLDRI